jgi:hypothetical protein
MRWNRQWARLTASILVLAVAAGCSSNGAKGAAGNATLASGLATTSSSASATSTPAPATSLPIPTWKPVALTATPDTAHTASGTITAADGGELTATDAAGVRYRLIVPAGAVTADLAVVLTPLAGVAGVPGQTAAYAVDIAPAGTQLALPARLDITPPTPLGANRVWLETTGSATAPQAIAGLPMRGNKAVLLTHFSGGGVVAGSPATSAAFTPDPGPLSRQNIQSPEWLHDFANYTQQKFNDGQISREEYDATIELIGQQLGRLQGSELSDRFQQMEQQADAAIEKAEAVADAGQLSDQGVMADAAAAVLGLERAGELTGTDGMGGGRLERAAKAFDKWLKGVLSNCAKSPVPGKTLTGWRRERALLGSDDENDEISKLMDDCDKKGYVASGGGGPVSVSGAVADVNKPFTLQITTPGGSGSATFTPSGTEGGSISGSSSTNVTAETASGAYEISENPRIIGYSIVASVKICFTEGPVNGCNSTNLVIQLTPASVSG